MSPQLIWSIAGLIITILTLGGVTLSSTQSMEASRAKMVASEIATIATASKLYIANDSTDGTYAGANAKAVGKYIPSLNVTNIGPVSELASKAFPGISYTIKATTFGNKNDALEVRTSAFENQDQVDNVKRSLSNAACEVAATPDREITYTCKG